MIIIIFLGPSRGQNGQIHPYIGRPGPNSIIIAATGTGTDTGTGYYNSYYDNYYRRIIGRLVISPIGEYDNYYRPIGYALI